MNCFQLIFLGTTIAPKIGALLIFTDAAQKASKAEQIASVQIPYLGLAGLLILLAVFVKMIRLPDARKIAVEESERNHDGKHSVWQYKHHVFGMVGIFCYVGAEVSIGFSNSIMFPTIFSLATKNLGKFTNSASGILCTAIVGGALIPLLQGKIADDFLCCTCRVCTTSTSSSLPSKVIKPTSKHGLNRRSSENLEIRFSDGLFTLWHNDLNDRRKKWPKSFCCMACTCIHG